MSLRPSWTPLKLQRVEELAVLDSPPGDTRVAPELGMSMTMVSAAGGADNVFEGGSVHFSSGGGNGLPAHSSQQHLTDVQAQQMGMQPQHNMLPPASPHDLPSGLATPSGNLDDVDKLLQARLSSRSFRRSYCCESPVRCAAHGDGG